MKHLHIAAVLGLLATSGGVLAQEVGTIPVKDSTAGDSAGAASSISYTFAEVGYSTTDLEDTTLGIDGFMVRGGYLITPELFVTAGYHMEETDNLQDYVGVDGTVEIATAEIGVGYRMNVAPGADLNAAIEVVSESQDGTGDLSGESDDNTGYRLRLGARTQMITNLEVSASGAFVSLDHDHNAVVTVSGMYDFLPFLGAGLDVAVDGDTATYAARVRYRF